MEEKKDREDDRDIGIADNSDYFENYNFFPETLQSGETLVLWKKEQEASVCKQ